MFKVNLCLRVAVFAAEVASTNYHHLVGKDLKKTDRRVQRLWLSGLQPWWTEDVVSAESFR